MILIAHVSDPHLGPLPPIRGAELMGKRGIGYLNWKRVRGRVYDDAVLDALVADLRAARPDHIVVTGDLVNLALDAEFDRALGWLRRLGEPGNVTLVPGNHDAYVPGAAVRLARVWRAYMQGDGRAGVAVFPFLRKRAGLGLLGVSTAVASPPLMAIGHVGRGQAEALGRLLAETGREGLIRVVLMHHSPVVRATRWHRRLTDARRVRAAIAAAGAELVLHGHNHLTGVAAVPGPRGPVPVVGAAAASMRPRPHHPGAAWNLIRIDKGDGAPAIAMTERGFTAAGAIATISERTLTGADAGDAAAPQATETQA